jgi:RHS repeat-associated protein
VGNRTRLTWPDGNYLDFDFDGLNRNWQVRENGATAEAGVLATYVYDKLSRVERITHGNASVTSYGYDLASRLQMLTYDVAGTAQDGSWTFAYYSTSQLKSRESSNRGYEWLVPASNASYAADGLNRYSSVAGTAYGYDARGNLTSDGVRTFTYDIENRLLAKIGGLTLIYDPLGRLYQATSGSSVTQFLYEGDRLVAEYPNTGVLPLRRYAHGPGVDNPLVWYEGAGLSDRRWLHADERGSILASSDSSGNATAYTYDPYGQPNVWSGARFRYTGQAMLPEAQLYHYKARVYDPALGRFLQTDPVGYDDDFNLYAYVGNDPLDRTDPTGTESADITTYSLCKLGGEISCERPAIFSAETAEAFSASIPGFAAIGEYEKGNYKWAVALGALDAGSFGKGSALRSAMIAAGERFTKGEVAHHVVAQGMKSFEKARELLNKFGIDIHDAAHGAKVPDWFHQGANNFLHGDYAANATVNRLSTAAKDGANAIRNELRKIGLVGRLRKPPKKLSIAGLAAAYADEACPTAELY